MTSAKMIIRLGLRHRSGDNRHSLCRNDRYRTIASRSELDIDKSIGEFLRRELSNETITYQTGLFSEGYMDSLALADLVMFIQNKFGVTVPASSFTLENFDTIENQARLVQNLLTKP